MDSLVAKQLELIATKLGVAAELLWGALLKQAIIDAWFLIGFLAVAYIFLVVVTCLIVRVTIHDSKCVKERDFSAEWFDADTRSIIVVAIAIAWGIMACFTPQLVKDVITAFYNPEFYALNKILH